MRRDILPIAAAVFIFCVASTARGQFNIVSQSDSLSVNANGSIDPSFGTIIPGSQSSTNAALGNYNDVVTAFAAVEFNGSGGGLAAYGTPTATSNISPTSFSAAAVSLSGATLPVGNVASLNAITTSSYALTFTVPVPTLFDLSETFNFQSPPPRRAGRNDEQQFLLQR